MAKGLLRVGIVGASSLMGKELAEAGDDSGLGVVDVVLLDEDVEVGQVTAAGDEATFVQRIETGSFEGMDLCFFAGDAGSTRRHWQAAVRAGAGVVDLTDALVGEDGVAVRSPWVPGAVRLGLETRAVAPVHPVGAMLGLVAARCAGLGLRAMAATVMEPASERGTAGLDEMHQQTVKLLSFQPVPKEEYDAQVAFNLLVELGAGARVAMERTEGRIRAGYRGEAELAVQVVHAPVFHGYGVSLLLEFGGVVGREALEGALSGDYVEVVGEGEEAPSNASVAGRGKALVRVGEVAGRRVWVWMVADNLRVGALQGMACGVELLGVRPRGTVQ